MLRRPYLTIIVLAIGSCSLGQTDESGPDGSETLAYWTQQLARLQAWPADVDRLGDMTGFGIGPGRSCLVRLGGAYARRSSLPPVLYLLDRADPASCQPGDGHAWCVLDVRHTMQGVAHRRQGGFREAVLSASRALDLLLGQQASNAVRVGLVGEGYGATTALLLAATRPDDVAFVCGHEPLTPPDEADERWCAELPEVAALVETPTLLSLGTADPLAEPASVTAAYEALKGVRELAVLERARHCQQADLAKWQGIWQEWVGAALGYR